MLFPSYLILAFPISFFFVHAIYFDGPCPEVKSKFPNSSDEFAVPTRLLFYAKVESRINHLFYRDEADAGILRVHLTLENSTFLVSKSSSSCRIFDILVPNVETGYYRHEIHRNANKWQLLNSSCGSFWDRYQVLQTDTYVLFWGCTSVERTSLNKTPVHEEGLWVLIRDGKYEEHPSESRMLSDVSKFFPVGHINFRDMERTRLNLGPKHGFDCSKSKLQCKGGQHVTESKAGRNIAFMIFLSFLSAGFLVAGIFVINKCCTVLSQ